MGSVSLFSLFAYGLDIHEIRVEVDISPGLPGFHIVGLAGTVVQESKDRIRAALLNSGFTWPRGKITVNLAPADLHKVSSLFDLPIVLGILAADCLLSARHLEDFYFVGELSLSGTIRGKQHLFLFSEWATRTNKRLVIPSEALPLLAHSLSRTVFCANTLRTLVESLRLRTLTPTILADPPSESTHDTLPCDFDMVIGHSHAKRGLEIAATGNHHVCLWGPPGSGKTLLARSFEGLLPSLSPNEANDVRRLHSLRAETASALLTTLRRPFRSPHHSVSLVALLGGGTTPAPGDISLAHKGILFLDELAEFPRSHIEALRQPLTDGRITIGRAHYTCTFPAEFQLIAATNPCPCGYYGDLEIPCRCYETTRLKYHSKLSGPLLDRIDIHLHVRRQPIKALAVAPAPSSAIEARARVLAARTFRATRPHDSQVLSTKTIPLFAFSAEAIRGATDLAELEHLSGRSFFKLLSLARTIADLDQSETVKKPHLEEAWSFKEPSL